MHLLPVFTSSGVLDPDPSPRAATAATAVNARGDTITDLLRDIPNHTQENARYGARQGTRAALAVLQTQLGHNTRDLHPVSP